MLWHTKDFRPFTLVFILVYIPTSGRHLHALVSCLKGRLTFLSFFLLDASFSLPLMFGFLFLSLCIYIGGRRGGGIYQHFNWLLFQLSAAQVLYCGTLEGDSSLLWTFEVLADRVVMTMFIA